MYFICILIVIFLAMAPTPEAAPVGVDATMLKQFNLEASPLDVATSEDGKLMFVLVPGKVLVYSDFSNQPVNRIPVGDHFDRLALAEKIDLLILSSQSGKQVKMVRIDLINEISIDGSPFLGKADAPVTIAVFDDYQ